MPRYSPGDRINIYVHNSPEYGGDYVVGPQGTITLPYAGEVKALGTTTAELSRRIEKALVKAELFKDDEFRVAVRPVQFTSVNISIQGAVFIPGRSTIGFIKDTDKSEKFLSRFGDNPTFRGLSTALRSAGGIRPDADLSRIRLTREGKTYILDWRGVMFGYPVDDVILMEGDVIVVPETGCFQSGLVRLSQVTPDNVKIFASNLTVPGINNNASAIANGVGNLGMPYGSRMLQGLVYANCVGGTVSANAGRYGVLISRNPKTLQTEVIQRSIEELVRSADRDAINPYLMPDDAIACYDSRVTEYREILSTLSSTLAVGATYQAARPR